MDNFVNILPGDEDLGVEEDAAPSTEPCQNLVDFGSDDDVSVLIDFGSDDDVSVLVDFGSDDDVSVLRELPTPLQPSCSSFADNLMKALAGESESGLKTALRPSWAEIAARTCLPSALLGVQQREDARGGG